MVSPLVQPAALEGVERGSRHEGEDNSGRLNLLMEKIQAREISFCDDPMK
jgi:hypothetical protein